MRVVAAEFRPRSSLSPFLVVLQQHQWLLSRALPWASHTAEEVPAGVLGGGCFRLRENVTPILALQLRGPATCDEVLKHFVLTQGDDPEADIAAVVTLQAVGDGDKAHSQLAKTAAVLLNGERLVHQMFLKLATAAIDSELANVELLRKTARQVITRFLTVSRIATRALVLFSDVGNDLVAQFLIALHMEFHKVKNVTPLTVERTKLALTRNQEGVGKYFGRHTGAEATSRGDSAVVRRSSGLRQRSISNCSNSASRKLTPFRADVVRGSGLHLPTLAGAAADTAPEARRGKTDLAASFATRNGTVRGSHRDNLRDKHPRLNVLNGGSTLTVVSTHSAAPPKGDDSPPPKEIFEVVVTRSPSGRWVRQAPTPVKLTNLRDLKNLYATSDVSHEPLARSRSVDTTLDDSRKGEGTIIQQLYPERLNRAQAVKVRHTSSGASSSMSKLNTVSAKPSSAANPPRFGTLRRKESHSSFAHLTSKFMNLIRSRSRSRLRASHSEVGN